MTFGDLKGALDNFSLIPQFFHKSWDFYTIRSVYICSDCMLNLTCNFNSVTKIFEFFFQQPFLKVDFLKWLPLSWLWNLALSTIILVWKNLIGKLVSAVLWTDAKINWTLCKLWHFGLEWACFKQQHEYKLASSPLYAWWFLHFKKEFFDFSFCICKLAISFTW